MDVFLPVWIILAYAMYVFTAERLSPLPPRKYNLDKHGIRAYKRVLGYWVMLGFIVAGLAVSFLFGHDPLITKGIISMVLGVILSLPGVFWFYTKRRAT